MSHLGNSGFGMIYPATRSWGSTAGSGEWNYIPDQTKYTISYDFNNSAFIRQESVINGHVEYIEKGERQKFKITVHSLTKSEMATLLSAKRSLVKFRPHTDNEDIEFSAWITKVEPFYLKNIVSMDALLIELESQEYVNLAVWD